MKERYPNRVFIALKKNHAFDHSLPHYRTVWSPIGTHLDKNNRTHSWGLQKLVPLHGVSLQKLVPKHRVINKKLK